MDTNASPPGQTICISIMLNLTRRVWGGYSIDNGELYGIWCWLAGVKIAGRRTVMIHFVTIYSIIAFMFFCIFMIFFWGFMKICNRYYQNYYQKLFATKDILSWIYVIVAFMVIILGLFEMCLCCNTMSINHYLGNNGLSMIKPMLEYCLLTGLSGTFSFLLLFRSGLVYFFSKKIVKLIEEEKKQ